MANLITEPLGKRGVRPARLRVLRSRRYTIRGYGGPKYTVEGTAGNALAAQVADKDLALVRTLKV